MTYFNSVYIFLPTQWIEQLKQGNVKIIEDSSTKVLVNQLVHNMLMV